MKRILSLLAILLMAMALPQKVFAYNFSAISPSGHTLYYNINVDGTTVSVTYPGSDFRSPYSGHSYPSGALSIPSTVTNSGTTYIVTAIGQSAFQSCSGLTSITIPNDVTYIGPQTFQNCSGLTSINIPDAVTYISNQAFENCSGLNSISIPNAVSQIGYSAFANCSGLTSVIFNASNCVFVNRSGCGTGCAPFRFCTNITSFTFGNDVEVIPAYLCSELGSLSSITLPNGLTSIGDHAFYLCSGLTSVTIPDGVTSIGSQAFWGVKHIEYHGTATGSPWGAKYINNVLDGDFLYTDVAKTNLIAYLGTGGDVVVPSTVSGIGNGAFANCTGLTSVTIPNSVTSVGMSAFRSCSGLTSVTIGNSVTTIGEYAFEYCTGLTSVTIPNSVTDIGNYVFQNCSGLTSVTISNSVASISVAAFSGCSSLTSVIIPNSVASISASAFFGCSSLTSVTIPNSVTSISTQAFSGCSSLPTVVIPNTVTSIGYTAFSGCSSLSSISLSNSVTYIDDETFKNCTSLTSIIIPSGVTSIGEDAFYNCNRLAQITSLATVAPTLDRSAFRSVPRTIPVFIPCGSQASYTTRWSYFNNIIEDCLDATLNAQAWYAISSPVHDDGGTAVSVDNVTNLANGTYDLLRYNEAIGKWESQKAEGGQAGFSTLEQGRGYIYRRSNDATLTFVGRTNTGDIDRSITHTCGDGRIRGFNLLGNPYNAAYAPTRDYYTLLPSGMWTAHTSSPSNTVAAGEAFFIYDNSNDAYAFVEPSSAKNAPRCSATIALTVSDGDYSDVAYMRFDDGEGLPKMAHLDPQAPALSIQQGDLHYAVANFEWHPTSIPLHFSGYGTYTFRLSDNSLGLAYLHLIDRENGADIDLLRQPSYTFNTNGADGERFTLRLNINGDTFVRVGGSRLIIDGDGVLLVYDVMGRQLGSARVNGTTTLDRRALGMGRTGVYVVRLNGNSQKIVIK